MATRTKDELIALIGSTGEEIRAAKGAGATKDAVGELVKTLLSLKAQYKDVTGEDFVAAGEQGSKEKTKAKKTEAAAATAGADARNAKKAERLAQREEAVKSAKETQAASKVAVAQDDAWKYGDAPLIQSREITGRRIHRLEELTPALGKIEQEVWVRARVHTTRSVGQGVFFLLRQYLTTVQAVIFAGKGNGGISKAMIAYAKDISRESVVDIRGIVKLAPAPVESATESLIELHIYEIHCISASTRTTPLIVEDASRPLPKGGDVDENSKEGTETGKDGELPTVALQTALDFRWIDLRTPANQGIFRIQSGVCALFREFLSARGFTEIHSPKLLGGASEGGAEVFKLDYFGQPACLAQSPQFYKQMAAACGGFERVFEIGPVFRAEKSNTHRHLTEFTGLDFEMCIKEHYHECLDLIGELFIYIFDNLNAKFQADMEAVNKQYPFEPLQYCRPTLRLSFHEGMQLLQEAGYDADPDDDLPTDQEKALGKIVKEKFGTDFFIMDKYPLSKRPFYTMPCPENPKASNSYDVFIRGEEIISGAQRVHDVDLLVERAKWWGIPLHSIASYLDAFRHGAEPHAGGGIGMERVVMLFLGLKNIRKTSMFPRDTKRLAP